MAHLPRGSPRGAGISGAARAEGQGHDFASEAKLLSRIVACASSADALPAELDAKVIDGYCKKLVPKIEKYRKKYVGEAQPFLAKLQPDGLSKKVVYPAGGGDLLSALTTYPAAEEVTTMSLEHAGDPRRVKGMTKKSLVTSLKTLEETINGLITLNDSRSDNLMKGQRGDIPGQLAFFLVALEVHGYEPVSLRYFQIAADGTLDYLDEAEIAQFEPKKAGKLNAAWTPPDFSEAFSNLELGFRAKGSTGPVRYHRHVAANLADDHLEPGKGLLAHLAAKGRVVAMTKAASYLLWRNDFSEVRDYLLANMDFMISDSTGIPPKWVKPAGFVQETYGTFVKSFLPSKGEHNRDFLALWSSQPKRPLPFRYGYIDGEKNYHLVVTKRGP
ncbi:hypothetical protein L6R52_26000 [Myxococcota bacterium]|nr:hypothetical protein [Myxococcota bacterium]